MGADEPGQTPAINVNFHAPDMLSDDDQAALLNSIERVRQSALNHLGSTPDASTAISFITHLHRAIDKVAQQADDMGPKTECTAGCAHCCSVRVEATEPEIFRIAREVKKRPVPEVDALVERLQNRIAAAETDSTCAPRIDCAFLEKHLCSIYDVRPAVCRKAHSLSAQRCKDLAPEIPQNLGMLLSAEALMKGTADAYRQIKLCASAHELCRGVLLALTDETAETRWYDGDDHA